MWFVIKLTFLSVWSLRHDMPCRLWASACVFVLKSVNRIGFIGVKFRTKDYIKVCKRMFFWLVQIVSPNRNKKKTLFILRYDLRLNIYDLKKSMPDLFNAFLNDLETNQWTHYFQIKPFVQYSTVLLFCSLTRKLDLNELQNV